MAVLAKDFKLVEFAQQRWFALLDHKTKPEEVLDAKFWAHVAGQVKKFDEIGFVNADGKFYGRLFVADAGINWVKVRPLELHDFTKTADRPVTASPEEFKVKYRNPHLRYGVFRKADNALIKDGFAEETDAKEFIKTYCENMAA